MLRDPDGKELKAEWKPVKPGVVEVKLPLQDSQPGTMSLMIDQYGLAKPHLIPLRVFSNAARLDGFTLHAGDAQGVLSGSRLDEVASLTIRSEEHTSELQSLMRISYAVFCLKKKHIPTLVPSTTQ